MIYIRIIQAHVWERRVSSINQKGISHALTKNNSLRKIALATIVFLLLATGLTFVIQPAKAASVTILSSSGYLDIVGGYWIYGEVQNLDAAPVRGVWITATYYDSSNTIIEVENGYTFADVILPNQKSPFDVLLYDITQGGVDSTQQPGFKVDHYTLAVNYTYTRTASALPLGLKILSSNAHLDEVGYGYMNITGEVENTGTTNATYTKVLATFYDSDGKVVYTGYTYAPLDQPYVIYPGQKAPFNLPNFLVDRAPQAKSYVLSAESNEYTCLEFPALPLPPMSPPTSTPSASPTSTSTSPPTVAQLFTVAWAPPPANAAAATAVTAIAVGAVSIVAAAVTNPVGTSAGKAAEKANDLIPESVKKWLSDFASSKRKPNLDQKTGSPFLPTKAEALAYGVSLAVLTISFSYVKVNDFTLILAVLPTILATAVIVEFVKTFALVAFARKLGVWTEHRLWYFGLAMFLATTFAFGIPFSSPSRSLYHAPEFTKRREGIVSAVAILVTLAFGGGFFVLLVSGFTLIGSTGLAMCIIMAFLDTFPVAPMNGKAIYQHSKAAWAALFAATLAVYISWLILL